MTFLTRQTENRLFEPFFARFTFLDDAATASAWAPAVDVAEDAERIHVKVEVPGMEEKDLRVHYEDGLLTISGERQFERREDRSYLRIERAYGSFTRSFTLPRSVDPSRINASYKSGVLEIEIPKKEEARPRQIEINIGSKTAESK